jgi:hypothetical protein
MTLGLIDCFVIPRDVIVTTNEVLRRRGADGFEAFVLWTGRGVGREFNVRSAYVPRQTATKSDAGVCVTVAGEDLHKLNLWLFEHKETLAAQVHTHPTGAYHSETDDAFPIVTTVGGLSIVVPFFAKAGVEGPLVATYRLDAEGWTRVADAAVSRLVKWLV